MFENRSKSENEIKKEVCLNADLDKIGSAAAVVAAAVIISAVCGTAAAVISTATEKNNENKYDPQTRIVTAIVSKHKNTPFRRCVG